MTDRPTFPPLQMPLHMDDLDARLDRRAAARGIPTLRDPGTETVTETEPADAPEIGLALVESGLAAMAGGSAADSAEGRHAPMPARRRAAKPLQVRGPKSGSRVVAHVTDAPTPRSRMKSLNVELPDYVWIELKSRAAREMVSVRHVIMTLLAEADIEIASADMIEDGRRLR